MQKIHNYVGKALKTGETGYVSFSLWIDDGGALFIEIIENETATKTPGTHTKNILIRASDYINERFTPGKYNLLFGIKYQTSELVTIKGSNDHTFLKAILQHLFP